MRNLFPVAFAAILCLSSAAFAASPTAQQSKIECTGPGSEVSALIDADAASPNISAVRAVFERGVADCMEGRAADANKYYREAMALMGGRSMSFQPASFQPASSQKG